MKAFLYGLALQFKLDIRSRTMLLTAYVVPLIFFGFMGGIFISVDPSAAKTLIPSMSVFVITMGALMGLPSSVSEIYGTDIKKMYKANGVPAYQGVLTLFLSSFFHLAIVCAIIFAVAPFAFKAAIPQGLPLYFLSLALYMAVTLAVGCVLGLLIKSQAKLTMTAMILFLPSVMLSGIMFPASMLPNFLQYAAYIFPATIAFKAMTDFSIWQILTLAAEFIALCAVIGLLLKRVSKS